MRTDQRLDQPRDEKSSGESRSTAWALVGAGVALATCGAFSNMGITDTAADKLRRIDLGSPPLTIQPRTVDLGVLAIETRGSAPAHVSQFTLQDGRKAGGPFEAVASLALVKSLHEENDCIEFLVVNPGGLSYQENIHVFVPSFVQHIDQTAWPTAPVSVTISFNSAQASSVASGQIDIYARTFRINSTTSHD